MHCLGPIETTKLLLVMLVLQTVKIFVTDHINHLNHLKICDLLTDLLRHISDTCLPLHVL